MADAFLHPSFLFAQQQLRPALAVNRIAFDHAAVFLLQCLENIDSFEVYISIRETGEARVAGPRDVLAAQEAAVDLIRLAEAEDLRYC